jgi:hypothetical protein
LSNFIVTPDGNAGQRVVLGDCTFLPDNRSLPGGSGFSTKAPGASTPEIDNGQGEAQGDLHCPGEQEDYQFHGPIILIYKDVIGFF